MESGAIADSQVTASSENSTEHSPKRARLYTKETDDYSSGAWLSLTSDLNQWLQVDLGKITSVTHVATQGRNSYSPTQMVTKCKLQFSDDGESFLFYKRQWESSDAVNGNIFTRYSFFFFHMTFATREINMAEKLRPYLGRSFSLYRTHSKPVKNLLSFKSLSLFLSFSLWVTLALGRYRKLRTALLTRLQRSLPCLLGRKWDILFR